MTVEEEILALESQRKHLESQIKHHDTQAKIWRTERRKVLQKMYRLEQKVEKHLNDTSQKESTK